MYKLLSLSAFAIILTGCAGLQPKSAEDVVVKRAEERMAALQSLDFKKAYSYMTPGYREIKDINRFKAEFAGAANIVNFSVSNPSCVEDRCVVTVTRNYEMVMHVRGAQGPKQFENNSRQVWVRLNGKWWYSRLSVE